MLVIDLGGQYSQLIARRVRECRVYSELVGHTISPEAVRARNPYALILSGGPASVYAEDAPRVDPRIFELGIPTLGICYGMQLMALDLGGRVDRTGVSEFGKTELQRRGVGAARRTRRPSRRSGCRTATPSSRRPRARASSPARRRRRSPRSRRPSARSTACSSIPRSCTRRTGWTC